MAKGNISIMVYGNLHGKWKFWGFMVIFEEDVVMGKA